MRRAGAGRPSVQQSMGKTPERILVIKMSSLGDIVHALPAVAALRQRFPQSRLTWLVKSIWAPILEGNPDVDEIMPLKDSWKRWPEIIHMLRNGRFDLVVDFQGLFRSGIFAAITGASTRVGFARAREGATWFYTHEVPLPGDKSCPWRLLDMHAVERNLAITEFLGAECSIPVYLPLRPPTPPAHSAAAGVFQLTLKKIVGARL